MKLIAYTLSLFLVASIYAQEEEVLPEPSEPPFEVGALPLKSGYTIVRKDAPDLNFRIVENKMRLYWIDEDGLIMEPEVDATTVRFDETSIPPLPNDVRSYHRLKPISGDTALGAPYYLRQPHHYYVTLVVRLPDSEELESFRFRYMPSMDAVTPAEAE